MVRHKHRFLIVQVWSRKAQSTWTDKVIFQALQQSLKSVFGDFGTGSAAAALSVKCFDFNSGLCVVRVGIRSVREVWASLSLLNKIGDEPVACRVLRSAGSARTCKPAAVKLLGKALSRRDGMSEEETGAVLDEFTSSFAAFEG
mmetsp:Transcript_22602/g.65722  ORF Transcript_22602/g.65722 Transcript_22602/m.65722 type:complete len:144 (-) Transcript_22602:61-492(-)